MKKELCAFLAIISLIAISIGGYTHLSHMTDKLSEHMDIALLAIKSESYDKAQYELEEALKIWNSEEQYTHTFIRHSEVDSVSDAFYDAITEATAENKAEAQVCIRKLLYHINSIQSMERITLRSVF